MSDVKSNPIHRSCLHAGCDCEKSPGDCITCSRYLPEMMGVVLTMFCPGLVEKLAEKKP